MLPILEKPAHVERRAPRVEAIDIPPHRVKVVDPIPHQEMSTEQEGPAVRDWDGNGPLVDDAARVELPIPQVAASRQ